MEAVPTLFSPDKVTAGAQSEGAPDQCGLEYNTANKNASSKGSNKMAAIMVRVLSSLHRKY